MGDFSEENSNANRDSKIGRTLPFLTLVDKNAQKYKCKICKGILDGKKKANLVAHFKIERPDHKEIYNTVICGANQQNILIEREEFIFSAVELCTINSEPFAVLSKSGFRNGHKQQLERFKSAGCPVNVSNEHLTEIKEKVRTTAKQIKEQIKLETHRKVVSIMVDSATRNGRSFFGISLQYKHNGVVKVVAVGMRELKQSHTAEYLATVLLEVLAEYEIDLQQIISITTDNGSNMIAMVKEIEEILFQWQGGCSPDGCESEELRVQNQTTSTQPSQSNESISGAIDVQIDELLKSSTDDDVLDELLGEDDFYEQLFEKLVTDLRKQTGNHALFVQSIKCAAHTLQLAVKDALNLLPARDRNVIDLCRLVAKFLRTQSIKNEIREKGLTSVQPRLDAKTRWSSTYLMIESILKCKHVVEHFAVSQPSANLLLKKWHILEELKTVLRLPYLSTVMLQTKDYTLSDFYGLLQMMEMQLNKMKSIPCLYTKFAENLQSCLNTRKKPLVENPLMRCAMFLDPRYKCDIDSNKELVIFVKLTLEHVWQRIKTIKNYEETNAVASEVEVQNKSSNEIHDLFAELDNEYDAQNISPTDIDLSQEKNDIELAINAYEQFVGERMKSSESIHNFWEKNKLRFGRELYEIAITILAIPPTQSSVERYFSALKYLFDIHRYNLSQDLLESCMLINLNPDFFNIVKQMNIDRLINDIRND